MRKFSKLSLVDPGRDVNSQSMAVSATVIMIAAIVMGCGSDSAGNPTSNQSTGPPAAVPPPSKSVFIRRANSICKRARAGLGGRVSEFERRRLGHKAEPGADAAHFVYVPTMEEQIWRIEKLGVPYGEAGRIDAMLDAEQHGVNSIAVTRRTLSIIAAERYFAKANRLFRAYGLNSCADNPRSEGTSG